MKMENNSLLPSQKTNLFKEASKALAELNTEIESILTQIDRKESERADINTSLLSKKEAKELVFEFINNRAKTYEAELKRTLIMYASPTIERKEFNPFTYRRNQIDVLNSGSMFYFFGDLLKEKITQVFDGLDYRGADMTREQREAALKLIDDDLDQLENRKSELYKLADESGLQLEEYDETVLGGENV